MKSTIFFVTFQLNAICSNAAIPSTSIDAIDSSYSISNVIGKSPAADIAATGGLALIPSSAVTTALDNSATAAALSIKSFDDFRGQMHTIVSELRSKINDILNQSPITCT